MKQLSRLAVVALLLVPLFRRPTLELRTQAGRRWSADCGRASVDLAIFFFKRPG